MAIAINQDALDKLAFCFGRNSAQYNAVVSAAASSPFLAEELNTFGKGEWHFVRGAAGSGTFANPSDKVINFDPSWTDSSVKFATVLAHELGHALLLGGNGGKTATNPNQAIANGLTNEG